MTQKRFCRRSHFNQNIRWREKVMIRCTFHFDETWKFFACVIKFSQVVNKGLSDRKRGVFTWNFRWWMTGCRLKLTESWGIADLEAGQEESTRWKRNWFNIVSQLSWSRGNLDNFISGRNATNRFIAKSRRNCFYNDRKKCFLFWFEMISFKRKLEPKILSVRLKILTNVVEFSDHRNKINFRMSLWRIL